MSSARAGGGDGDGGGGGDCATTSSSFGRPMLPPQKPQPLQPHSLQWSSFPDCAARREVGWVLFAGVGTRGVCVRGGRTSLHQPSHDKYSRSPPTLGLQGADWPPQKSQPPHFAFSLAQWSCAALHQL